MNEGRERMERRHGHVLKEQGDKRIVESIVVNAGGRNESEGEVEIEG